MCGVCGCEASDLLASTLVQPVQKEPRLIHLEKNLFEKNNFYAECNRARLNEEGILALNFVSSPGAGKTTLLVKTIEALQAKQVIKVVEGDQQSARDADKIRASGAPAVQINTGKGCHLEAQSVGKAFDELQLAPAEWVFIENVGNLVCPAEFDLGEHCKVVILSVTEGDDKALKYPHIFRAAKLLLISKIDLLPYVDFDLQACIAYARQVNPTIEILTLSSKSAEGLESWFDWLFYQSQQAQAVDSLCV